MLGILSSILNEVAAMPTEHTWAAKIMALPSEEMDYETEKVDKWIQEVIKAEFPDTEQADRIVREMWPAVMEQEAIEAYLEIHPAHGRVLPLVEAWEAAWIVGQEIMASPKDEEVAKLFLQDMYEGKRVPPFYRTDYQPSLFDNLME